MSRNRDQPGALPAEALEGVLDFLADPVVVSDETGTIVYINAAVERLLGHSGPALVGRRLTTLMPARFHDAHEAGFRRFMATRKARILGKPIRVPALHEDGTEIDVELTLAARLGASGETLVIASLRDLRERVELERQIASQRKIVALYAAMRVLSEAGSEEDAMPRVLGVTAEALGWDLAVYWRLDRATGRLALGPTWASRPSASSVFLEACQAMTFAPGEGLPGRVLATGAPVWSQDVRSDDRYVRARLAAAEGLRTALLFPVFCARGTYGVLEYLTRSAEELDDDLLQAMAALGFQIGQFLDRLEATERLRFLGDTSTLLGASLDHRATLAEFTRLLVPALADWCDVEVRNDQGELEQMAVAHVDPTKADLARELRRRLPPGDAPGSGLARVIATGRPEWSPEISDELLAGGARDAEELRLLRALGLRSSLLVPLVLRGRPIGAVGLYHGESGRRYAQADLAFAEEIAQRAAIAIENARLFSAAQEAIARRDEFLSIASHELRTPLTSLGLYVDALLREASRGTLASIPPETVARRLGRIKLQAERLDRLVAQLLDVSRAASGRLTLDRERFDLGELVGEVVGRFAEEAAASGTSLEVICPGELVGAWDRDRLDQVLTNLLSNALKYAAGQPVEIRAERRDGHVRLVVRDRGPGVAETDRERIFERFERTAVARNIGGIGLGLWIVREIVRAHGGSIRAEAAPGQGAAFVVEFPDVPP